MAKPDQTTGTVLSTEMGSGQSRYRLQSGGYRYRTSHYPAISYQYTVNGQQYIGNTYSQRPSLISSPFIIQRILDNYPVGSTVKVYYNPNNPQEAYLQKGYGRTVHTILVTVVLLILIILAITVIAVLATSA